MKRYNAVQGGVYDNSIMVEEDDGDYVWYEDVEQLEALNAQLLEALEWIAWQYDDAKTVALCANDAYAMSILARAAIAKAKGEQP